MIRHLGMKCRAYHYHLLDSGFLMTDKIYFDEMESYIHSKVYPVSLGLAVDVQYKRILDIRVAEIKTKGALKRKVLLDCKGDLPPKIANRPNSSRAMLIGLLGSINKSLRIDGILYSDAKRAYIPLVNNYLHLSTRFRPEKSRTKLKEHCDPQALGRFSSVCAYLRAYVSTMGRRTLITAKSKEMLEFHLFMAVARYNKYDLNEILKHGAFQEDFFDREWRIRKENKIRKNTHPLLVAHIFNLNQKEKEQQVKFLVALFATILLYQEQCFKYSVAS